MKTWIDKIIDALLMRQKHDPEPMSEFPPEEGHAPVMPKEEFDKLDAIDTDQRARYIDTQILPPDHVLDNMTDDEAIEYGLNAMFRSEEIAFDQYRKRRRTAREKIRKEVAEKGVKDADIDETY